MEIKVLQSDSPEYKAQAWKEIQALSPDMAEKIKMVRDVFGPLESVSVETSNNG